MSRKRNNKFRPKVQLQTGHLKDKINILKEDIKLQGQNIDAINASHNLHIQYLSNFMSHDIKNCIQNMDAILSTYNSEEISDKNLSDLRAQITLIREIMANFSEFVPHGAEAKFKVTKLIDSIESMHRTTLFEKNITFTKSVPQDINLYLVFPFHSLLQIFSNIIINACNNLNTGTPTPCICFDVKIDNDNNKVLFSIYDNGSLIPEKNIKQIFEYGYSTTEGTGIGLYHVDYLCKLYKGKVEVRKSKDVNFTKYFLVTLPLGTREDE